MQVNFINVGGSSMNWTAEIESLTYDTLLREIKSKGAVMSRSIEFKFDDATGKGQIIVGMFRNVGEFEVVNSNLS